MKILTVAVIINNFSQNILHWYEHNGRKNLPWQGNNSYHVWISEIMLQQTQVKKVIDYFTNFIAKFPTLKLLAQADTQEILVCWSGLGYYNRARNLHKTAQICVDRYSDKLPQDLQQLIELPGIGKTTAGAILSLASNLPHPILDGNVKRVMSRVFAIRTTKISELNKKLWGIVTPLVPRHNPRNYNQALMDLGSMICTRTKPKCTQCPLMGKCKAYLLNKIDLYPQKKAKTKQLKKNHYVLMLVNNKKIFLQQRGTDGIWPQLWFLPIFNSKKAMLLSKEFDQASQAKIYDFAITHILTHRILNLQISCINTGLHDNNNLKGKWIELSNFKQLPHPTALIKIVQQYQEIDDENF